MQTWLPCPCSLEDVLVYSGRKHKDRKRGRGFSNAQDGMKIQDRGLNLKQSDLSKEVTSKAQLGRVLP